jgi:site-specific DNA recombinase
MKLRKIGVMLRSATEATDETPSGILFANMLGAFAQFDNDMRAERTLMGMKATLDKGRWPWRGPTGYLNGRPGEPSLIPDPISAPFITKLFELIGSKQLRKSKALEHVTELGLRWSTGKPLTQETLRKILTNPLDCGRMEIAKWGKSVHGDFEPLVSEDMFDQVQLILAGRVVTTAPHVRSNPSFPLRGTLLCTLCGLPVTASGSRGRLGRFIPFTIASGAKITSGFARKRFIKPSLRC